MQYRFVLHATMVAMLVAPAASRAQTVGNFAAWVALTSTPAGGLPGNPFLASLRPARSVQVRFGRLNFNDGDSGLNIAGLTFTRSTRNGGQASVTVGSMFCEGCDGSFMLGVDGDVPLKAAGTLLVALRPAVGVTNFFVEGGGYALSGALSLLVSAVLGGNGRASVVPFIDPGIGFGMISFDGETEQGVRPMLGGGVAILGSRVGVNVSAKRVMLEGATTQFGAGLIFALGGKK